ncbi:MAG TPA: hypothetical protein VJ783_20070 [Pirellulales bacterium]|nr:hypothetical protein [Pirellulales bacterium]
MRVVQAAMSALGRKVESREQIELRRERAKVADNPPTDKRLPYFLLSLLNSLYLGGFAAENSGIG